MSAESHNVVTEAIDATEATDALAQHIAFLVRERQALRAAGAEPAVLEQNRVEIARAQQQLSAALIARHLPAAA